MRFSHVIFGVLSGEGMSTHTRVMLRTLGGCRLHTDLPLPCQDPWCYCFDKYMPRVPNMLPLLGAEHRQWWNWKIWGYQANNWQTREAKKLQMSTHTSGKAGHINRVLQLNFPWLFFPCRSPRGLDVVSSTDPCLCAPMHRPPSKLPASFCGLVFSMDLNFWNACSEPHHLKIGYIWVMVRWVT